MVDHSYPHFLVDSVPGAGSFVLDGPEGRHAATVRRLRVGEHLVLADGRGNAATGIVTAAGKYELTVDVSPTEYRRQASPAVTVVQAIPKGDRAELAVDLMTEAGVDAIVPWSASRCIARWSSDKAANGVAKWTAVAREAAKQSRRVWVPEVHQLHTTADVVGQIQRADLALVLHEAESKPLVGMDFTGVKTIVLIIGPEGGIAADELTKFRAAGAVSARLGYEVLRTSTAGAVALGAIGALTARWQD